MFRAAFPNASDAEERAELQWVKDNHDLSGNNGSTRDSHITRLAGTWVDTVLAADLGEQYALGQLIKIVADAQPDPNANYKRSAKSATAAGNQSSTPANGVSQQTSAASILANAGSGASLSNTPLHQSSPMSTRAVTNALPTPSPTGSHPNPPKRRKESSPAFVKAPSPVRTPLRRTAHRSPAPKAISQLVNSATPARTPKKWLEQPTPASDKAVVVDEEGDRVEAMATNELHEQDVREQKKLIEDLKLQRAAAQKETAEQAEADDNEETANTTEEGSSNVASSLKRRLRDENEPEFKFKFKEPEVAQREIASNSRVRFQMKPQTRSLAWGVAAFAVGMGAV